MVAFEPLSVPGLNWACISRIDLEEAIAPKLAGEEKDFYAKYIDAYGYYDLFLIHPEGRVFYSVTHEADYGTNMVDGEYKDTGLGKLVRRALETKEFGTADFEPYAPSNGEPAAFIAQPVLRGADVELIVALQLSIKAINSIMQERSGMGRTGETYLVGSDKLMRSDSYLDPRTHSVKASFADPVKGRVDTEASREALAGNEGRKIVIDYNGNPVLSAHAPLKIGETTWALLAEIDEKEVVSDSTAAENLLNRVWLIGVIAVIAIVMVILFNVLNIRDLLKTLRRIIEGLSEGSDQVSSASSQVSSASQSLAEGSSEQAASLEETSSSLEEMASMTARNAENAKEANDLMTKANETVRQANDSMGRLTSSMEEISKASEDTSKIIKTIDEIAFQTNLLALNAAVEAARAGEAGAGFAVVADEVRNLAMRAAEAAKSTSGLIEGTRRKVRDGSELVNRTNSAFSEVARSTAKVGELVGEIAAASNEQAQGIQQTNKAVAEMDKVVQQNAANAEENAGASEEMNAQAEQMKIYVAELLSLVGETGRGSSNGRAAKPIGRGPAVHGSKSLTVFSGKVGKRTAILPKAKEIHPERMIPLGDKDLSDF
ncbi:MAG: methyl-accepting chemotaxis protein [Deltaproteobacteria bacterium]|nr:methyl-accepting chemotaxis protein [Deltaproteobacteria bacterium]